MSTAIFSSQDETYMRQALACAAYAQQAENEIPVGAVLVHDNEVLATGWNRNITLADPTAHAEIVALRKACTKIGNYRLPFDTTLYVTLEPCAMCAMAFIHARISRVVYAASDPKTGAAGSVFNLLEAPQNNHQPEVQGGLLATDAGNLLRHFFRLRRQRNG